MNRRIFLLGSTALVGGCTLTVDQVVATASAYVNLIAAALPNTLKQLQALNVPWLTGDKVTIANAAIAGFQSVATSLGQASTQAVAQPLIQKLELYLMAFLTALPVALLPPPFGTIVSAAIILLPVVYTMVNLAVPTQLPAPTISLTTDQAATVLAPAGK